MSPLEAGPGRRLVHGKGLLGWMHPGPPSPTGLSPGMGPAQDAGPGSCPSLPHCFSRVALPVPCPQTDLPGAFLPSPSHDSAQTLTGPIYVARRLPALVSLWPHAQTKGVCSSSFTSELVCSVSNQLWDSCGDRRRSSGRTLCFIDQPINRGGW